jgi:pyruvate/oxaloacetate carboxyltransferase
MTKIYVLDNGSLGSRLLQHEYKDQYEITPVKVNKGDLVEQFTKIENKDGIKVFLPFDVEDLVADNEKLRREIQKVEHLGFRNLIVLPYEGRSKQEIEFFAKKLDNFKVKDQVPKGAGVFAQKESKDTVSGRSTEV